MVMFICFSVVVIVCCGLVLSMFVLSVCSVVIVVVVLVYCIGVVSVGLGSCIVVLL